MVRTDTVEVEVGPFKVGVVSMICGNKLRPEAVETVFDVSRSVRRYPTNAGAELKTRE